MSAWLSGRLTPPVRTSAAWFVFVVPGWVPGHGAWIARVYDGGPAEDSEPAASRCGFESESAAREWAAAQVALLDDTSSDRVWVWEDMESWIERESAEGAQR